MRYKAQLAHNLYRVETLSKVNGLKDQSNVSALRLCSHRIRGQALCFLQYPRNVHLSTDQRRTNPFDEDTRV